MRTLAVLALSAIFTTAAWSQAQSTEAQTSPNTITIPNGTRVLLAMRNSVSTRTGREGDGVYLEATEPVALDNHVVIPEGTQFQGKIVSVERAGKLRGRASLRLNIDRMIYRNGYVVEFNSALRGSNGGRTQAREGQDGTIKAESSIMRDTLLTGVGALGGGVGGMATGAVVGGVFGDGLTGARVGGGVGLLVGVLSAVLVRGQEVMLPQGTTVEIEIRQPLELDMNRVPVGSPQNYVPPQRPAPPAERAYHRRPPALPFPRLPF